MQTNHKGDLLLRDDGTKLPSTELPDDKTIWKIDALCNLMLSCSTNLLYHANNTYTVLYII